MDWRQVFGADTIYMIYGPPMIGKTRLAVGIADNDLKAGRNVVYIATEFNLKPILDKIKPHVSELHEYYDPMELANWVDRLGVSKPTTVIIDSLGGVRMNYMAEYSKATGGLPDTARVSMLIQVIVHRLMEAWAMGNLKVILINHESPSINEPFFGEDTYPTSAKKALHDVGIVVRLFTREVTEGNVVKVERVGKVILDRYGLLTKDTLNNPIYFALPEPLF
jgi:RecA/RadA recombinase